MGYTAQPTQQGSETGQKQAAQKPIGSIAMHPSDSRGFALCVVAAIQTLFATKYQMTNPPDKETIKAQVVAAAKGIFTSKEEGIEWNVLGVSASPEHLAAVVRKVLENNGVQTNVQLGYDSVQTLAAALIASQQPTMINLHRAGALEPEAQKDQKIKVGQKNQEAEVQKIEEHAVTVQWDPSRNRFRISNIAGKGGMIFPQ